MRTESDRGDATTADTKPAPDERWADLASLLLTVGRSLRLRVQDHPGLIHLAQTEGQVMQYIDNHPGCSATDIARATGLQRSNLSPVLTGLVAKGLVERNESTDRRTVELRPTALAQQNLARLREEWEKLLRRASGGEEPTNEMIDLLRRVDAGLLEGRGEA